MLSRFSGTQDAYKARGTTFSELNQQGRDFKGNGHNGKQNTVQQNKNKINKMKKTLKMGALAACAVLALGTSSVMAISTYDIVYNETSQAYGYSYVGLNPNPVTDAVATIQVENGFAVSGTLTVTAGPDIGHYILVSGSGADSDFQFDSAVPLDSSYGLLWTASGVLGNSEELNMWANNGQYGGPANTTALWGAPTPSANAGLTFDVESFSSTATITDIPDGGMTASLLGTALIGLATFRRKLAA